MILKTTEASKYIGVSIKVNMGQEERILEYLKEGNSLTPLEALHKFGCFRLGARIWDIKRQGYTVKSEIVRDSDTGKHYCKYWLEREEKQMVFV